MEEAKERGGQKEEEEVIKGGGDVVVSGGEVVRVLVVDDSPVDRKVVEILLKRSCCNFEVVVADSGKKALEVLGYSQENAESPLANERKIDMILTDYFMPEMTGYDLLVNVKGFTSTKSIPVVIMSSENDLQRINRCIAAGAEDFMLKPLRIKDMQQLRTYARPTLTSMLKSGTKRKIPMDVMAENNRSERERRPHLAGVAVA